MIRGDGGSPDGWIKPENVTGIDDDQQLEEVWSLMFGKATSPAMQECQAEKSIFGGGKYKVQLYNLTADPTEHHDISGQHPDMVRAMLRRLDQLEATMIPPDVAPETKEGNPNNFGGFFSTGWCEAQPKSAEDEMFKEKEVLIETVKGF